MAVSSTFLSHSQLLPLGKFTVGFCGAKLQRSSRELKPSSFALLLQRNTTTSSSAINDPSFLNWRTFAEKRN
jgi:hypothetical protein